MDVLGSLEQLGLEKKEAQIYLYLLTNGPSSPTEIANATGIKRPNIYGHVKILEQQGLIHYQLINKRKRIAAAAPSKLAELLQEKLQLAKLIIPKLARGTESGFKSKITFYQGKRAMINLFNEALEMKGRELLGFWSAKDMDKILDKKTIERFIVKRLKKGIALKTLHPIEKESFYSDEIHTEKGKRLTQIAYTPDKYTFSLSMQIYDDTVAFYSSQKESYGFKVESREFTQVMRVLYEIAWEHSGKLNVESHLGQAVLK